MKTLLFSPPKYNNEFITVNDCCWGTGELQVLQDRLLRTGSYLLLQGDEVGFLDAGMLDYNWVDVFRELKEVKSDRLIFQVVPQFESWQMIIANMCNALHIKPICIGITWGHEKDLVERYEDDCALLSGLEYHGFVPSWDKMPPINWSLLGDNYPCYITYQISDGCPYSCTFCVWGRKDYKLLPPELVVENLKSVRSSAPIYLLCAQITTNKKWLEKFVELKEEFNLDFGYATDINSGETSEDKIEMLKNSGCVGATMGIESTNPEILEKINKKTNIDDVINTIELCHKYRIELTAPFMYNIDPSENVENDINFYKKYKTFKPSPGIMKIYPGTRLWLEVNEYEFDYIFELGTNPVATNKGLNESLKKLEKWESVLNG